MELWMQLWQSKAIHDRTKRNPPVQPTDFCLDELLLIDILLNVC